MISVRFIFKLPLFSFFFIHSLCLTNNPISQNETKNEQAIPKTMKINTDLIINGNIQSRQVNSKKLTVKEKGMIEGTLIATEVFTDQLFTETTYINSLISPNGIIVIDGDVMITNEITEEGQQNVHLKGDSFAIDGVKQFGVVHHDDFDSEESLDGWSNKKTNRCSKNGNAFLGGHCNFSFEEVKKTYKLPEHSTIRITAGFHMFDNWNGERGYMKIDNEVLWSREGQIDNKGGINFCGGDSNDPAFNLVIDITAPHKKENVTITFGSTLEGDPCNASFGVDDVMIYIK